MAYGKPTVYVLLTFDFEEWEAKGEVSEADLYHKTKRVTDLLKEKGIAATFFLDAYTTLKYPEAAVLLRDEGHELALHSDYHWGFANTHRRDLDWSTQGSETQISRIRNATMMIRRVIPDFKPRGFRAPGLKWNEALYVSLSKLGYLYDSSQQDNYAFKPFLKKGIVVFPVNSGDYDSACYKTSSRYVVNTWVDHFKKAYKAAEKAGESYFLLLAHPSVSGRYKYVGMLKAILVYLTRWGVEFNTCSKLASKYLASK